MTEIVGVTGKDEVAQVSALARAIWVAHYVPIIGREQVDYMLEQFQSEEAIAGQIADGREYYLLRNDGANLGYLCLVPEADAQTLMISKIYVADSERGKGYGRRLLAFTENLCRMREISSMWLTVNKNNTQSIAWYEGMGFRNTGAVLQDIGGGFVMDDYRLEKTLTGNDSLKSNGLVIDDSGSPKGGSDPKPIL